MIQFDSYFSKELVQPPTSEVNNRGFYQFSKYFLFMILKSSQFVAI